MPSGTSCTTYLAATLAGREMDAGQTGSLNLTAATGASCTQIIPVPVRPSSSLCIQNSQLHVEMRASQGIPMYQSKLAVLDSLPTPPSEVLLDPPKSIVQSIDPELPNTCHKKEHQTEPHAGIIVHSYSIHSPGFKPLIPERINSFLLAKTPALCLPVCLLWTIPSHPRPQYSFAEAPGSGLNAATQWHHINWLSGQPKITKGEPNLQCSATFTRVSGSTSHSIHISSILYFFLYRPACSSLDDLLDSLTARLART